RRLYPRLAEQYRVYAPDWLGFGMSEHHNVAYTGEFYATMLGSFLRDVVGQPAIILAHGHAANIAVRCASDAPALMERLILVAPDVFAGLRADPTPSQALTRVTQRAFLGILPYAFLSSKPVLRWMTFNRAGHLHDTASSEERVEHLYASAHQFGGQHALLAYLTGELDLPMQNAFALLQPPVLVLGGDQDHRRPRVDLEDISVLNPYAELELIPGAGDPIYDDRHEPVLAALTTWLATPREHHAPTEDALLLPSDDGETAPATADDDTWPQREQAPSAASTEPAETVVSGGIEHADSDSTPIVMPTEGDTAPEAIASAEEAEMPEEQGEPQTGTPGAVVPGVSDMGLDGPSTTDVGGVAALEDDGVTLGPPTEQASSADDEQPQSPAAMLPEAGDAAPDDPAEQSARSGEDPAVDPGANIGYTAAPTTGDAVDTAEMMEREKGTRTNPAAPRTRERGPSRATRAPAREPSPRGEPASKSGGANRAKRGPTGGGAAKTRKHGSQTEHRKRPDTP
ncbi:MAG: alpha/beta fold hydrolase, partial [Ktedonobacterales bacterium]